MMSPRRRLVGIAGLFLLADLFIGACAWVAAHLLGAV